MTFSPSALTALVAATSFAAGLNVYAAVATLGLLAHYHVVVLPASLDLLAGWPVIGASLALYAIEFVTDKIPAIDLVSNALQTFVRVPVAALIAYGASARLTLAEQLLVTGLATVIALAAHGGKTAARVAVTPSPEPVSNIALSVAEDGLAVFVTWLATRHPFWAAGLVAVLLVLIVLVIRAVVRAFRVLFRGAGRQLAGASTSSIDAGPK